MIPIVGTGEAAIKDVKLAAYNPKDIEPGALEVLKESLRRFGFVEPVRINKRTMNLIDGHQRLRAWQELGHDTVPFEMVDCDETEEKQLNLTLNNRHIEGEFDLPKLNVLQEELGSRMDLAPLELGLIGTGETTAAPQTTELRDAGTNDAGGYLKMFRLCFTSDEWDRFQERGQELIAQHGLDGYSGLVLWLVENYAV